MKHLSLLLIACSCLFLGGCGDAGLRVGKATPAAETAVNAAPAVSETAVPESASASGSINASSATASGSINASASAASGAANASSAVPADASVPAPADASGYRLVWEDAFEETEINREIWTFEEGNIRNHELQYYTDRPENARVENGELILESRKEDWKGSAYTSASIRTRGVKSFLYGKMEMRAKLPEGKGIWPAFWAMGDAFNWPGCGEIDIMEVIGGGDGFDNVTYGTGHWSEYGDHGMNGGNTKLAKGNFADDYHIFGVEWDEKRIQWLLDGVKFHELDITPKSMSEFHQPFWLLLNLAVGGDWPGSPDDSTVFPQQYRIDWVRVHQR